MLVRHSLFSRNLLDEDLNLATVIFGASAGFPPRSFAFYYLSLANYISCFLHCCFLSFSDAILSAVGVFTISYETCQ